MGEPLRPHHNDCDKERPKLTLLQQIEHMRDKKGISFTIVNEHDALNFLRENNYYFKLKAFAKNYSKCNSGDNAGKYYNLEFAYLQELSTLDMYLREQILSMILDIEHFLKVRLLADIAEDSSEDGYHIVDVFLSRNPHVEQSIQDKARNSYCEDLVFKHRTHFSVWSIVEVLSFGDLLSLCDCYYSSWNRPPINIGSYRIVKFLRNAAAHNNCLINNLADNSSNKFNQSKDANSYVSLIPGISAKVRGKKMGNRFVHDFVVMLLCFDEIVSSPGVHHHQLKKLKLLIDERFTRHAEYFGDNALLCTNYEFVKKIVDKINEGCV